MPENAKPSKNNETAKIICTVEDSGQFGFSNCGNCGALLKEDSLEYCPECGVKLDGVELGPNFGGSDF